MIVRESSKQNFYPDFTLMKDESDNSKIAVDIKTTYRNFKKDGSWSSSFTLGGYTSFLRHDTKNIEFPYSHYQKDYIIGFIYSRVAVGGGTKFYRLIDREQVSSPLRDVEWFVQEKYRIAGERAGSGNTTNIGSVVRNSVEGFAVGDGPFAILGEEVFVDYWRNYGRTKATRPFNNLKEYFAWYEGGK